MNILQSIETLSDADAKKARTQSRKLIKAALQKENIQHIDDVNLYDRPLLIELPLDLIFLPYYQENRKMFNKKGVQEIKANFKKNRFEPIRVNFRKDGKYKNLFFVNDGEHRITVADELGKETIWALTYSTSTDEKALLFANQHENTKLLEQKNKFLARISVSGQSEDKYVKQAHLLHETLVKYHIDLNTKGIAYGTLASVGFVNNVGCQKDLKERYDWIFHILKYSNFYTTHQGLGSTIIIVLNRLWSMCFNQNIFDGVITPKGLIPILTEILSNHTTNTLINAGKAIFEKDRTLLTATTDKRKMVAEFLIYSICQRLSIEWKPNAKVK